MRDRLRSFLGDLNLSQRFRLASLVILLAGMAGIGAWVAQQVETGVVHRTGATTALYVDSFVAPQLQELASSDALQPEHAQALGNFIQNTPIGKEFVAFKVWNTRGQLLFSTDKTPVGRTYPMHEGLLRARLGTVFSEVSPLDQVENAPLAASHSQLLETYSPVWLSGTDKVIAVAEFYQLTDELDAEIRVLQVRSWMVVGLAMLGMYLLLAGFVGRASNTITSQGIELDRKVRQLTALLSRNRELHDRVKRAAASVALLNENYLRRIGSELHDGPAQDLGLALLKLDAAAGELEARAAARVDQGILRQLGEAQTSVANALKEVRGIAMGASLPQLADLDLRETVQRVVLAHQRSTNTKVALDIEDLPDQVALPVRITVYRLIQEALNNAFRHANGLGQQVRVVGQGAELVVEVSDSGPGFHPEAAAEADRHLGISGMRERVQSLGGLLEIESQPGMGTKVVAHLPFKPEGDVPE